METLGQAALSGLGLAAGTFLLLAILAAFGLKGRSRGLGITASFGVAAVFGTVALIAAEPQPPPGQGPPQPAQNAAGVVADKSDARGLDLIAEAEQQLNRGDTDAAGDTIARALRMFEDQDDPAGQGFAHLGIGRMAHFTGQGDEARDSYRIALELFRLVGKPAEEARVLMALGDLEMDVFNWDAAAENFRQGRAVWVSVAAPKSDPHVLLSLESVAMLPDGEEAAWDVLREAKLIFENLGDSHALDEVAYARAEFYLATGDLLNARGDFGGAAEGFLLRGNHSRAATSFLRAARIDIALGHNLGAEFLLDQAATSFAQTTDPLGPALLVIARGDLARLVGALDTAATFYKQAAGTLAATVGAQVSPEEAEAHLKLGQIWQALGDGSQAEKAFNEALAAFIATDHLAGAGAASLGLGQLSAAAGNFEAARLHWSAAVDAADRGGDPVTRGRALLGLARAFGAEGDPAKAQAAVADGEALFRRALVPIGVVLAALEQSELARSAGDTRLAAEFAATAGQTFQGLEQPVAAANRFLSLPPVDRIDLSLATRPDTYRDGQGPIPGEMEAWEAERLANLAAFPGQNAEAHMLLAQIDARLRAASTPQP